MFNRRRRCRRAFAPPSASGEGTNPLRLVTREDAWMAPPVNAEADALFRSGAACATERDLYRLSTAYAPVRHSYGPDMLLVSDRYEFIAIQIWKVASRTLLKALGEFWFLSSATPKTAEVAPSFNINTVFQCRND